MAKKSGKGVQDAQNADQGTAAGSIGTQAKWEKWITGIGIGAFIMAAIGMFFYATAIRKLEPTFDNLKPYIMGLILTAGLFLALEFGRRLLRNVRGAERIAFWMGVGAALLCFLVGLLGVSWLGIYILQDAGLIASPSNKPIPPEAPPVQFDYVTCPTYASSDLPDATFGSMTDFSGKPRKWMEIHELGAKSKLNDKELLSEWLLTPEFKNPLAGFTEYVYVGTGDGIEIDGFLVRNDGYLHVWPLKQVQGQGPKDEYVFDVPQSKSADRLLVYVGIKKDSYNAIQANPKFLVRSKPR